MFTLRRGLPGEATQATHEKRVLVLERALEHHPASEPLMVELLEASAPLLDAEALCVRWQQVGMCGHVWECVGMCGGSVCGGESKRQVAAGGPGV